MNDYWLGPLIEVDQETARRHLEDAKQLSLSLRTGCRPRRLVQTAGPASPACGCAPMSSAPKTAWPRRPTSASPAASEP
jgi:hypothetical protein